jgi:hypothetical protein
MIYCYEMRKVCGSCVEHSALKEFGSMFDAGTIHAQFPSNIQPNYQQRGKYWNKDQGGKGLDFETIDLPTREWDGSIVQLQALAAQIEA